MRYWGIAVVGLWWVAAPAAGQPPPLRGAKLQAVPAAQGRLAPQLPAGPIQVRFRGPAVLVASVRDVSNVVLEYADGARQKFDALQGRRVELRGTGPHTGKVVVRAWVKAGPNFSGDGPGYGQKFERPRAAQ